MRRVLVAVLVAICIVPAEALARTILVVGDSLSAAHGMELRAGWVSLLRARLAEQKLDYRIVNASVSGDTTASAAARLPRLLEEHRPDIVILELGGNDGLRGLSPARIKHNLSVMIAKTRAADAKVLLVGIELPPNYGRKYTERFRRVYRELATEQQVALVPSIMEGFATDRALMQPDGIHPNARAQPRMLENVWGQLWPML
ncbi:MAG: arylesterase [Candidatus Muproteobacteria bacterium RIFCSPHIGHO2_01_FULL_65_16]|uniref:Arylesterase n=1 Tax=Candidatus Muproteobacteria bacterium RIFCSPHIGHO2_01_FULL_65_16 TaxID=1817764 RepID=A0A1F6THY8_9PROT|nr:MAG: arylesterase [Candidatus Muproteobacteria bacterium RIFCSPHIGHO2_01_FULL_65_16]